MRLLFAVILLTLFSCGDNSLNEESLNHWNKGADLLEEGKYEESMQESNKAIELDSKASGAYANRGFAKHKLGDSRGALKDLNKAIELHEKYGTIDKPAEIYFNRGVIKSLLDDDSGACDDWSKAGELGYTEAYELIKENCR